MPKNFSLTILCFVTAVFVFVLILPPDAQAQRRDYLTDAEIELVRDAQEIDKRVEVLMHAATRRVWVLNNQTPEKEKEKWGALPTGTRLNLLTDIQKLLQKAIDDIDDVATRNMENPLFPKAVHRLADACREFQPHFKTFLDNIKEEKERGVILSSIDQCNQVFEAAAKIPREPAKEEKKKKKN